MSSIFTLKTEMSDLDSSNHGILSSNLRQVPCSRGVDKNSFSSGVQNYRFEMSGNKWWKPSESYMRIRCRLTKNDVPRTPLTLSDDVAPAMNLGSQLWQNMDFRMGDTTISRISNNVSQVSALKNRLDRSRSWNKSVGQSTNFTDEEFYARQNSVCSDGVNDDFESVDTERQVEANYNINDAVQYTAATNTAVITYTNVQSAILWRAGDLYTDFNTPANVPSRQVILAATINAANLVWACPVISGHTKLCNFMFSVLSVEKLKINL
jgi:hypothetical protein